MTELNRDVGIEEVVTLGGTGGPRLADGGAADLSQPAREQRIGAVLDKRRDIGGRRAAFGGVVLEAAVRWWVVGRRHDDAVCLPALAGAVVDEHGVGQRRGRRVPVVGVHQHVGPVGSQHLQRRYPRRFGQSVSVPGQEQRAIDTRTGPVLADRLRYGRNMVVVEIDPKARTAVAGRPKRDLLVGVGRVGVLAVVGGNQLGDVNEVGKERQVARLGGCSARCTLLVCLALSIWARLLGRVRATPSRVFPRMQVQATSMTTFRRPAWGRAYRK